MIKLIKFVSSMFEAFGECNERNLSIGFEPGRSEWIGSPFRGIKLIFPVGLPVPEFYASRLGYENLFPRKILEVGRSVSNRKTLASCLDSKATENDRRIRKEASRFN